MCTFVFSPCALQPQPQQRKGDSCTHLPGIWILNGKIAAFIKTSKESFRHVIKDNVQSGTSIMY